MVSEQGTIYRSINGRRYLTKVAAIKQDAKHLMNKKYPDDGEWYWWSSPEFNKIYERLLRFLKRANRKTPNGTITR